MSAALTAAIALASFHTVQVHAVGDEASALESVEDIRHRGLDAYYLLEHDEQGALRFKVRVGSFQDSEAARRAGPEIVDKTEADDFFITETDESQVAVLAGAMKPLVDDSALVSGILREGSRARRLSAHVHNYLTVYLLLTGKPGPGSELAQSAVWDTNQEDRREIQVVTTAGEVPARAYVLYWSDDHYRAARVTSGREIDLYDLWDIMAGPLRFIVFRVSRGGDLYREEEYVVVRWSAESDTYEVVGTVLSERRDTGEAALPSSAYSAELRLADLDGDQEQEVIAEHVGTSVETLEIYEWDGHRLRLHRDAGALLEAWQDRQRPGRSTVAAALLGIGRRHLLEARPDAAEGAWRLLLMQLPDTAQAVRARDALRELSEGRERARTRVAAGLELLEAGHPEAAGQELELALAAFPHYAPALYNSARVAAQKGEHTEALAYLRRAIRADPERYGSEAKTEPHFKKLRERAEFRALVD